MKITYINGIPLSHKKKEILPFAKIGMGLEGIMLDEISQRERDNYCKISITCGILKNQNKLTEKAIGFIFARSGVWAVGELGESGQ